MLQIEWLVTTIGFGAAEKDPSNTCQTLHKIDNFGYRLCFEGNLVTPPGTLHGAWNVDNIISTSDKRLKRDIEPFACRMIRSWVSMTQVTWNSMLKFGETEHEQIVKHWNNAFSQSLPSFCLPVFRIPIEEFFENVDRRFLVRFSKKVTWLVVRSSLLD